MEAMDWKYLAGMGWGLVLTLLQVLGLLQVKRIGVVEIGITKLADDKADKTDLHMLIEDLRLGRSAAEHSRTELQATTSNIAQALARLEGRLEGLLTARAKGD